MIVTKMIVTNLFLAKHKIFSHRNVGLVEIINNTSLGNSRDSDKHTLIGMAP